MARYYIFNNYAGDKSFNDLINGLANEYGCLRIITDDPIIGSGHIYCHRDDAPLVHEKITEVNSAGPDGESWWTDYDATAASGKYIPEEAE